MSNEEVIIDAVTPFPFRIDDEDINKGNRKDFNNCAAVLACERVDGVEAAKIGKSISKLRIKGQWYRYKTPRNLLQEIIAYDRGGQFAPGMYELKVIKPSDQLSNKRNRNGKKDENGIKLITVDKAGNGKVTRYKREIRRIPGIRGDIK